MSVMAKKEKVSKVAKRQVTKVRSDASVKAMTAIDLRPATPKNVSEAITQADAAKMRGISRASINELVVRGRLPVVEVAGRRFVLRSGVENFKDDRFKDDTGRAG